MDKADQALARLDEMLDKLDRLYQSADPEKQKDLRGNINEITRLREIVEKAKADLANCQPRNASPTRKPWWISPINRHPI